MDNKRNDFVVAFTSTARTASANADGANRFAKGARVFLDVTAASGTTPTLDVKIQARDEASGQYVDVPGAVFTQKTAASTDMLEVYPGIGAVANSKVSGSFPRTWRVVAAIGGTTPSFTFTVMVDLMV